LTEGKATTFFQNRQVGIKVERVGETGSRKRVLEEAKHRGQCVPMEIAEKRDSVGGLSERSVERSGVSKEERRFGKGGRFPVVGPERKKGSAPGKAGPRKKPQNAK